MKEKTISEHDEALTQAVARLKAGDRSALEKIFRLTGEALYVQARYLTNDDQAAEDLVQTTYVEVIGSIERLEGNSNFLPWAKGILRHKYLDAARRAVHTYIPNDTDAALLIDQMEDEDLAVDPEEITSQHDLQELLLKEIAKLPEEQRVALVLFHFERLSLKEIAEATGVPVNTVKSRLTYARRALKKEIEAYEKAHGVKVRNIGQIITAALASGSALVGTTFLSGGEDEKLWQTLQQTPEFKGFAAGKTLSAGQTVKNVGGLLFFLSAHAGTLVPAALITAGVLSLGIYAGSRLGLADLGRDPYAGTETVTSAYQSASVEESKPAESPKVRPFADQKPDTPVEPTERKDLPESELGKEDEEVASPQEAESERVEKENAADQTVEREADVAAETSEAEPRPEEAITERRDVEPAPTPTPDEKPEEGSIAKPEQEETQEEEPVPEEEENPEEEPADAESEEGSEQEPETTADENPSDEATDEETNDENDETDAEEDADLAADEEGDGESGGVEEG
ncbi:MAG: sigma-70 family RNA polymerase sigma factor, partial [Firmicutes bacterium]|nr:sigma-70 family RNA polymerase sigma factor [Bacillota bacterium]